MNEQPTHLDLFSGIGGFALAAGWAGFKTIGFCEIDPYCQGVLKKHWPQIPIHSDIKELRGGAYGNCTLLTGGFPCQPFSHAGKRRGKDDDRHLWPEMLRIIEEAKPTWIIGENVAGIINMELDQVCLDLEAKGYEVQPIVIPACAINAPHRRDRVWIICNSKFKRLEGHNRQSGSWKSSKQINSETPEKGETINAFDGCFSYKITSKNVANAMRHGVEGLREQMGDIGEIMEGRQNSEIHGFSWFERDPADYESLSKSFLGRVANGIPNRSHRLKGLGNAIVPQVAYQIIKGIRELL